MVIHDRKIDRDAMASGQGVAELLNEKAQAEIDAQGHELYRQDSPSPSSVCSANANPGPGTAPAARPSEVDLAALEALAAGARASLERLGGRGLACAGGAGVSEMGQFLRKMLG